MLNKLHLQARLQICNSIRTRSTNGDWRGNNQLKFLFGLFSCWKLKLCIWNTNMQSTSNKGMIDIYKLINISSAAAVVCLTIA